jgi:hypothetical protein
MSDFQLGSFVVHAKLASLGSGEVVALDKGTIRIRFASGERPFVFELVAPHLTITADAPARAVATPAKRARKKKA